METEAVLPASFFCSHVLRRWRQESTRNGPTFQQYHVRCVRTGQHKEHKSRDGHRWL